MVQFLRSDFCFLLLIKSLYSEYCTFKIFVLKSGKTRAKKFRSSSDLSLTMASTGSTTTAEDGRASPSTPSPDKKDKKEKKTSEKDLDLEQRNRGVWLVKVPTYIAHRWEEAAKDHQVSLIYFEI